MADANYGRRNTGADPDYGIVTAGTQRCYVPDYLSQTIIAYAMGTRAGKPGSLAPTPSGRMFIGNTISDSPTTVRRYTGLINPSAVMTSGTEGAVYTSDLTSPDLLTPADNYCLGLTAPANSMSHGMIAYDKFPDANNKNFYDRSNGSSIPVDPSGAGAHPEGHMTLWTTGEINVSPDTPTGLTPSGTLASTDLTPNLQANFSDANESLPNGATFDYLNEVHIQVYRVSSNAQVWDYTYTAGSTERGDRRSNKQYAGTALIAGVEYRFRVRHSDRAGAWSSWSSYSNFTINAGGTVTNGTTPTGKQNAVQPSPFSATWNHPNPLNAKAVRIIIEDASGNTVRSSSAAGHTLGAQVANGGTLTVTWAQAAPGADLPRGFVGRWRMLAQDTGNAWSPASSPVAFSINATPNVPTSLTPSGSATMTTLPKLSATATDTDDSGAALTVTAEILLANGSSVQRAMIHNVSTGKFEYQVTGTDVPSLQTVQWRAKVSDGVSESAWSAYATFLYGAGPGVTITAPTDEATLVASSSTITWTVPSGGPQVKYRVQIWELAAGDVRIIPAVVDTGDVVSAVLSHTVPATTYRNGRRYELVVTVTNGTPLSGSSSPLQFNVTFTPPATLTGATAVAQALKEASGTSGIRLDWAATLQPTGTFAGYVIYRRALGPAPGFPADFSAALTEVAAGQVFLRLITSPAQTSFIDGNVASGVAYEYEIRQLQQVGLDTLISGAVLATANVVIDHIMLTSARYPDTFGVELRYRGGSGPVLTSKLVQDRRKITPIAGRVGRTIRSAAMTWDDSGTFKIVSDRYKTADQRIRELTELVMLGDTCCLRDFLGLRRYVSIKDIQIERFSANHYEVGLAWDEELFIEGELSAVAA